MEALLAQYGSILYRCIVESTPMKLSRPLLPLLSKIEIMYSNDVWTDLQNCGRKCE